MTIDRRKLFALGGLGAIAAGTGANGPEILPLDAGAVTIKIRNDCGIWYVLVPDWDYKGVSRIAMPVKWMPLTEFLAALDGEET